MSSIIDRRKNAGGKSSGNRQRFIKRVEQNIKKAIPNIINSQGIKEISSGKGKIKVPIKGIKEPTFHPDFGTGNKDYIQPGNENHQEGDKIPKPMGGQGARGSRGSKDSSPSEDEFVITIDREEFLNYFFQDLELPNLVKKYLEALVDFTRKRTGYIKEGNPSQLNVHKSFKKSLGRRIGMKSSLEKKLEDLEEKLEGLNKMLEIHKSNPSDFMYKQYLADKERTEKEIEEAKKKLQSIPFMDKIDLRYNNFENTPVPTTAAVMFCIMDVSGSMGEHEKDIAKRFFTLLYIFLTKQYEHIDLVFIRHHTEAEEVSEEEFFNSRETGGTIVASALELCDKIRKEKYGNGKWNIYVAQASDGDIWGIEDAVDCQEILEKKILPEVQYMAYIEINGRAESTELWEAYNELSKKHKNLASKKLYNLNEIWTIFKDLFKKEIK